MVKKKTTARRTTPAKSQPVVSAAKEYWVLIWLPSCEAIPPYDSNPGSSDEGLLVYRSKKAATSAAKHQQDMYGDKETAHAIPLSQFGIKVSR